MKKKVKVPTSKNMINAHLPPNHLTHCKHNQNNIENINTYEQVSKQTDILISEEKQFYLIEMKEKYISIKTS